MGQWSGDYSCFEPALDGFLSPELGGDVMESFNPAACFSPLDDLDAFLGMHPSDGPATPESPETLVQCNPYLLVGERSRRAVDDFQAAEVAVRLVLELLVLLQDHLHNARVVDAVLAVVCPQLTLSEVGGGSDDEEDDTGGAVVGAGSVDAAVSVACAAPAAARATR